MSRKAENLRIPVPKPPTYNVEEAHRLIDEAFKNQGWSHDDGGEEIRHDIDAMRQAIFHAFTTSHVVTSTAVGENKKAFNEFVSAVAVTKYKLYTEVFPGAQHGGGRSPEEIAAKEFIADYIWRQCTATNRSGWLQKALAESQLVVLDTTVHSEDPQVPPQPGRYVTNVDHAMLEFLDNKVLADVQKKMQDMNAWLAVFYRRNPEIAMKASRKAKAAIKAAIDSSPNANPTWVRENLALNVAGQNGDTDSAEAEVLAES